MFERLPKTRKWTTTSKAPSSGFFSTHTFASEPRQEEYGDVIRLEYQRYSGAPRLHCGAVQQDRVRAAGVDAAAC